MKQFDIHDADTGERLMGPVDGSYAKRIIATEQCRHVEARRIPQHLAALTTPANLTREAVAEDRGWFLEVAEHEQRTHRVARHRAETPITSTIHTLIAAGVSA